MRANRQFVRRRKGDLRSGQPVKSAARCIAMLEFFAQARAPATVGDVAARLKIPQSSASMLLGSLTALGYIQKCPEARGYRSTVRLMLLGAIAQEEVFILSRLVAEMEDLRARTRGSVMLGMRQGIHTRYLFVLRGENPSSDDFVTGVLRSSFRVAGGKILLAQESDSMIGRLLRQSNAAESNHNRTIPLSAFLKEIANIRVKGWAESQAVAPGSGVIAIALPDLPGQPRLSLSIGLPSEVAHSERVEVVRELKRVISIAYRGILPGDA